MTKVKSNYNNPYLVQRSEMDRFKCCVNEEIEELKKQIEECCEDESSSLGSPINGVQTIGSNFGLGGIINRPTIISLDGAPNSALLFQNLANTASMYIDDNGAGLGGSGNYFNASNTGLSILIGGNYGTAGQVLTTDGTHATWEDPNANDDDWTKDANGVWNNTDNIGIGVNNPGQTLEVVGNFQNTFNNGQIINDTVNIPALNGTPPINGPMTGLYSSDGSTYQSTVYVGPNVLIAGITTPDFGGGLTAMAGLTNIQSENLTTGDNAEVTTYTFTAGQPAVYLNVSDGTIGTVLKIKKNFLEIDNIPTVSGSFVDNGGQIITVTKGLITSIV